MLGLAFLPPPAASGDPSDEAVEGPLMAGSPDAATAPAHPAPQAPTNTYAVPIPEPLPPAVAVSRFTNRSGVSGLDWMEAAVAFVAGEMATEHRGVRPAFDGLVVPRTRPAATDAAAIADLAAAQRADLVIAGSFRRPDWELELTVELWKVSGGEATLVGRQVSRGDFKKVHDFLGESLVALFAEAGVPVAPTDMSAVLRPPTTDFYAFTLFGRGLTAFLGARHRSGWLSAKKNLERAVFIDPELVCGQRILGEFYRAYRHTRYARTSRGKHNWASLARTHLERALEKRPRYAAAKIALARETEAAEHLERARDLYLEVVKQQPYDFEARYRLGKVLWDNGQADDSYSVLSNLVERDPDDVRVRRILVLIHSSRGSNKKLVSELEQVARLDPGDEATRMDLGAAYASVGRVDDAIGAYKGVVAHSPRNASALKFLGDMYHMKGDLDRAAASYRKAIAAAPSDPRAYFRLGDLYVESKNDAAARRVFHRAQRFRRYLPEVYANLGSIAYREGKLGEALKYDKRAVEAEPKKVRFHYNYALALSASGDTEAASTEIATGLKLDPDHVELSYLKGVVLLREGDVGAAQIQFERTLELDPKHKGARHNLAMISELERKAREGEVIRERPR